MSGAFDLLLGPILVGIQGGADLPFAGDDVVPIPFVGVRIGTRFLL